MGAWDLGPKGQLPPKKSKPSQFKLLMGRSIRLRAPPGLYYCCRRFGWGWGLSSAAPMVVEACLHPFAPLRSLVNKSRLLESCLARLRLRHVTDSERQRPARISRRCTIRFPDVSRTYPDVSTQGAISQHLLHRLRQTLDASGVAPRGAHDEHHETVRRGPLLPNLALISQN